MRVTEFDPTTLYLYPSHKSIDISVRMVLLFFRFKVNRKANRIMKTEAPDTESSTIEEKCDG